jgi:DNA-binding protein HU-beta
MASISSDVEGEQSVNKGEFIEDFAERCDWSKAEAGRVVDAILEQVTETLQRKDEIGFPGFGKFVTQERSARNGANPRDPTQTVRVPAKTVPKFRAGTALKEALADVPAIQAAPPARQRQEPAGNAEWRPLAQRG